MVGGKAASGRHWHRRKSVTKEAEKNLIRQSKPTRSYQLTNSPSRLGRNKKQKVHKDTHIHPEAGQPKQFKGPWGERAGHSAELCSGKLHPFTPSPRPYISTAPNTNVPKHDPESRRDQIKINILFKKARLRNIFIQN